jgi:hypothetical protein
MNIGRLIGTDYSLRDKLNNSDFSVISPGLPLTDGNHAPIASTEPMNAFQTMGRALKSAFQNVEYAAKHGDRTKWNPKRLIMEDSLESTTARSKLETFANSRVGVSDGG